jgi:hypothetical protein
MVSKRFQSRCNSSQRTGQGRKEERGILHSLWTAFTSLHPLSPDLPANGVERSSR